MQCTVLCVLVAVVAANNSTCGGDQPSKVPDCDKTDFGSCGNACCTVELALPDSPQDVYKATMGYLGAADGFSYVTGADKAGHNPGDDLRKYGIAWQFVFQGTHTTTGGYVDTIDINIKNATGGGSIITVFNIANIHGALGDNGQSYKTVKFMADALAPGVAVKIVHGCGGPAAPTPAPAATVCKSSEYCCPDAKKCLTPTSKSCATDATVCSGGNVCCPLTKICVSPGADCVSPCQGAFCCPDAKKCLTPDQPGKIVKGPSDCAAPRIFCPLTKLCVYASPKSCVPP
jgi:hypothetical protein